MVRGNGIAEVVRTGGETEVGRIGAELGKIIETPTLVQRDIRKLIGHIGFLALAFCAVVAIAYGVLRKDSLFGAVSGLTLAISLIPRRVSDGADDFHGIGSTKARTLQRAGAPLRGRRDAWNIDLLCVDKTGTITENLV